MTERSQRDTAMADIQNRTGIDEAMIERVVRAFYARVREDDLLGPVFDSRIENWELHLQRMFAFWSSTTLMSGRYSGRPMEKHLPLPVDAQHFDRWLTLFVKTAQTECPPIAAEIFIDRAERIATSLELGIAGQNGKFLKKGERFFRNHEEHIRPAIPPDAAGGRDG